MKTLLLFCILLVFCGTVSAQVETVDERLNLPSILGKWILIAPADQNPRWAHSINWMHFLPNNKIQWSVNQGPASEAEIRRGSYILMLSGNIAHHSTKRVLLRIDPTPYSPASGGVREDGTPIFLMNLKVGKRIDNRLGLPTEADMLKFSTEVSDFFFTKDESEQGGADQPATASQLKSEGKEKPKPESEPAPQ